MNWIPTVNANPQHKTIYTIGHSTHSMDEFAEILKSFHIELVADVRRFPGSRKYPQFNKEALEVSLPQKKIQYVHIESLGGRRKVNPDTKNTIWQHPSFRAYADFMETETFKEGVKELEKLASKQCVACMCSETLWWRCHRSMISDYLKADGWEVMHIMGVGKAQEHPYTQPAKVVNGTLSYKNDE